MLEDFQSLKIRFADIEAYIIPNFQECSIFLVYQNILVYTFLMIGSQLKGDIFLVLW